MIVRGCERKACTVDWEAARRLSNAEIRERYADFDLVCVEGMDVQCRHRDLQSGDQVLVLSAPVSTPVAVNSHADSLA